MPIIDQAIQGRILFVDDDPFYRELASAALIEAGFIVVCAIDGPAALAEVEAAAFDLVVLDLALPGLSGFEVVSHIRDQLRKPDLPILVITGHDDTDSVARAFDLGVKSFLAKPLNWPLFVHHVNFVLKSARVQASLQDATRKAGFMSDLQTRLVNILVTEFQTPLRQAYGFSTLLRREADGPINSPLYANWIADLHQALDRLNVTHAKMLNFGRSLSEGITLNDEVFDLRETLAIAMAASLDLIERRHLNLVQRLNFPAASRFRGDRVLIEQALRNLFDNAVRFSRRNSDICVGAELTTDGHLCLSITDSSPPLVRRKSTMCLASCRRCRRCHRRTSNSLRHSRCAAFLLRPTRANCACSPSAAKAPGRTSSCRALKITQSMALQLSQPAPVARHAAVRADALRDGTSKPSSRVQFAR